MLKRNPSSGKGPTLRAVQGEYKVRLRSTLEATFGNGEQTSHSLFIGTGMVYHHKPEVILIGR